MLSSRWVNRDMRTFMMVTSLEQRQHCQISSYRHPLFNIIMGRNSEVTVVVAKVLHPYFVITGL